MAKKKKKSKQKRAATASAKSKKKKRGPGRPPGSKTKKKTAAKAKGPRKAVRNTTRKVETDKSTMPNGTVLSLKRKAGRPKSAGATGPFVISKPDPDRGGFLLTLDFNENPTIWEPLVDLHEHPFAKAEVVVLHDYKEASELATKVGGEVALLEHYSVLDHAVSVQAPYAITTRRLWNTKGVLYRTLDQARELVRTELKRRAASIKEREQGAARSVELATKNQNSLETAYNEAAAQLDEFDALEGHPIAEGSDIV